MKLLVLSDLHVEMRPFSPVIEGRRIDEQADVVVLAGDIHGGARGLRWARETFPDKPIVYVAGNHEFYEQHWTQLLDPLREMARQHDIEFLEAGGVDLGGVRFLGCSLWTDFELFGQERRVGAQRLARARMNDYQCIRITKTAEFYWVHSKYLMPELTVRRHRASVEWLKGKLGHGDPAKTVVVTHHAPHRKSIPERFQDDLLSAAYASDLTHLMGQGALWIHGHIHDSMDYEVAGTRVLCNPRGYQHWNNTFENRSFDPELIVEV